MAAAEGHQVTLPAETASVSVTVTAAANDTNDGNRIVSVAGDLDGTGIGSTTITIVDDDLDDHRAGGHGIGDRVDGDRGRRNREQLHGGLRDPADGGCRGDGRRARGHGGDPGPEPPDVHHDELEHGPDGDR